MNLLQCIEFFYPSTGTSHFDDHAYLMNMPLYERVERTSNEKKFTQMMLDLWTSFAGENM